MPLFSLVSKRSSQSYLGYYTMSDGYVAVERATGLKGWSSSPATPTLPSLVQPYPMLRARSNALPFQATSFSIKNAPKRLKFNPRLSDTHLYSRALRMGFWKGLIGATFSPRVALHLRRSSASRAHLPSTSPNSSSTPTSTYTSMARLPVWRTRKSCIYSMCLKEIYRLMQPRWLSETRRL